MRVLLVLIIGAMRGRGPEPACVLCLVCAVSVCVDGDGWVGGWVEIVVGGWMEVVVVCGWVGWVVVGVGGWKLWWGGWGGVGGVGGWVDGGVVPTLITHQHTTHTHTHTHVTHTHTHT
jgi:hypothetical protein